MIRYLWCMIEGTTLFYASLEEELGEFASARINYRHPGVWAA